VDLAAQLGLRELVVLLGDQIPADRPRWVPTACSPCLPRASQQHVVVWTTIVCVISSIIVHGLSATPLTNKLLAPNVTKP